MKKQRSKGFTILELAIIIAVIGILAAAVIPSITVMINKANIANDVQVLRALNEAAAMNYSTYGQNRHDTMEDAVVGIEQQGYDCDLIDLKSNYDLAWESSTSRFVIIDQATDIVMYPIGEKSLEKEPVENKNDYYVVTEYNNNLDLNSFGYSIYAYGNKWPSTVEVHHGFDAGRIYNIKEIIYTNTSSEKQDIIIRSNNYGTKIVIGDDSNPSATKNDTVKHYGQAGRINVVSVDDEHCFNEYGSIGLLEFNDGMLNIKSTATIFQLNANVDIQNIDASLQAIMFDNNGIQTNETFNKSNMVECNHNVNMMLDGMDKQSYCFCKKCGYTLVKVDNEYKTVYNNDQNVLTPYKELSISDVDASNPNQHGNVRILK